MKKSQPPEFIHRFFRWFCHRDLRSYIEGDLIELYKERLSALGKFRADLAFFRDVILLFRPGIIRPVAVNQPINNVAMLKSYYKITLRNIVSNKAFSFINVSGLAIGMATCALIVLYVHDETGYDRHHTDAHTLYRVAAEVKGEKWVAGPAPLAYALKNELPEVEEATRLVRFPGAEKVLLSEEASKKQFFYTNVYYVDSSFFSLFTYAFKYGTPLSTLTEPSTMVISEEIANTFFPGDNPVGKVLSVGLPFGTFEYRVNGVFKNNHKKSHIPANIFLSMDNTDVGGWVKQQTSWAANNIFHTYIRVREGSDVTALDDKITDVLNRNGEEDFKAAGFTKRLFLQPVSDIYLHSNLGYEIAANGNVRYLYVFGSVAAFILLIACINFMNLSTARSEKRAREVGMRKVIGARRGTLVIQFLTESCFMSILSLIIAIILINLLLPMFNQLTGRQLSLLQFPYAYGWLIGLTFITGILAGIYPAFYLSSFKPISVLKGRLLNTFSAVAIRKGLVVFQFTISLVLILGSILITQQMSFLSNQSLGFSKNQKLVLHIQTIESNTNSAVLKKELLNKSSINHAVVAGSYPGIESITGMRFYPEGKSEEKIDIQTTSVEAGYLMTLGIELLEGRDFSDNVTADERSVIINETAAKKLGYEIKDAVGKKIVYDFDDKTNPMTIIGVVRDYHYQSLHEQIKPLALTVSVFFSGPSRYLIADISTTEYASMLEDIQNTWSKVNPASPFNFSFLDQDFQKNYEKETRTSQLIGYFTVVAILIACLGLFGLATFTAEQRTKEMGVRKVLGATASQIAVHLSADLMKLVAIAVLLSSPIAYYLMDKWLTNFAYHVDIKWWVFVVSGTVAAVIAFLTTSFQTVKLATRNPVDSLRAD
jgi:putative ABC transport system permease protein